METKQVRVGRDTILGYADRASPVDILAELIWNALDAEAMTVEVNVALGALQAPEEIVVHDDGHGMSPEQASELFLTHGDSWKRVAGFSPNRKRPMHGRLGRGRFLAYGVADHVEWRSVSTDGGTPAEIVIHGNRETPNQFTFDQPRASSEPAGTTVRMQARQTSRAVGVGDGELRLPLTARLAATLLGLPDVKVTFCGQTLDPRAHIIRDTNLDLPVEPAVLRGRAQPRLRIVEWATDMRSKTMYLCDEQGGVVTEFKPTRILSGPIHWTAYLQWEGFRDPDLMGQADLHVPDIQHGELLAVAQRALVDYLNRRLNEQKSSILASWKADGVYPYEGAPANVAEEVEREVFDIVAVVASQAIGRDVREKKFSLRLLQEATRAKPTSTNRILNAVLDLTDDEREVLSTLLERTRLASIVHAAQTVADRADFIHGLRRMLYADETRNVFREVDQLHPMLVAEPWMFGDEWNLGLSESGLTRVVRSSVTRRADVEFAPRPVVLPSGKRGRVDMVFYRHLPESERSRHLVVELKRPMRLTMVEFSQINNYATAITGSAEVAATPHDWDFWLVGTEVDDALRNMYIDPVRPGLTMNNPRYRIWVLTWGQLLDQAERRIWAFRRALELAFSDESSRDYLRHKHAEFIPRLDSAQQTS